MAYLVRSLHSSCAQIAQQKKFAIILLLDGTISDICKQFYELLGASFVSDKMPDIGFTLFFLINIPYLP